MIDEKTGHNFVSVYCRNCGHSHSFPAYCGDRLCPICKERNYYRLLNCYSEKIKKIPKYRCSQITLTYRNFKFLNSSVVSRVSGDLRKLRNARSFKNCVSGGLAVIECKHESDLKGWNLHVHVLVNARFLAHEELKKLWSTIVPGSFIVDIRKEENSIRAVRHLLKYFLKTPIIRGSDSPGLKSNYNEAFYRVRNIISFGSFYVKESKIPYRFKCPNCGESQWLTEFALRSLSERAQTLSGPGPPVAVFPGSSLVSISISERQRVLGLSA